MTQVLNWVVYDHPRDFPDQFVARLFDGDRPTERVLLAGSLEALREALMRRGLYRLERNLSDDPVIVETWL